MGSGRFETSWKSLAIGAAIVGLAVLATLVIVVATKNVDLLSTVALSLAILAFAAQLLIFIAQTASTVHQAEQSQQLNAETQRLLIEIRTRTQGAEAVLREQFDVVLRHALGRAIPEGIKAAQDAEGAIDVSILVRTLAESVEGDMRGAAGRLLNASLYPWSTPGGLLLEAGSEPLAISREDREAIEELTTYPRKADEIQGGYAALLELTPLAVALLYGYADTEVIKRRFGLPIGRTASVGQPTPVSDELQRAGMLASIVSNEIVTRQLTVLGRRSARLIYPSGPIPDKLRELAYGTG